MKPMFKSVEPLLLASNSPRRKEYFENAGLDFTVSVAQICEEPKQGEKPELYVARMAESKGVAIAKNNQDVWVVAADTIVTRENKIYGKPKDRGNASEILMELSGKVHTVATSFCLIHERTAIKITETVETEVEFIDFAPELVQAYIETGEPLDKAGAYGIQGMGGFLVKRINGSYSNVVGMPMTRVLKLLLNERVIALR